MKRPVTPWPCDLTAPHPERLGQRIRELRVDAEMTQDELAARMGSYRPVVGRIERGKHLLTTAGLERVAVALDLDVPTIAVVLDDEWAEGAEEARHQGDDPYSRYERRKAELGRTACSAAEYERELAAIADEEGV
jgi:transcriptional regulator with XRE-family HTH domain